MTMVVLSNIEGEAGFAVDIGTPARRVEPLEHGDLIAAGPSRMAAASPKPLPMTTALGFRRAPPLKPDWSGVNITRHYMCLFD